MSTVVTDEDEQRIAEVNKENSIDSRTQKNDTKQDKIRRI